MRARLRDISHKLGCISGIIKIEKFVANLDNFRESLGVGSVGVGEEEPVAVLQGLELLGDDPREGGAQHAT